MCGLDGVVPGRQQRELIVAPVVGRRAGDDIGVEVGCAHLGAWNDGVRTIGDEPDDGASADLGGEREGEQQGKQTRAKEGKDRATTGFMANS